MVFHGDFFCTSEKWKSKFTLSDKSNRSGISNLNRDFDEWVLSGQFFRIGVMWKNINWLLEFQEDVEPEEMDDEMDEDNDYDHNYFDNGESYNEEDDNLDDGPVY